MKKFDFLLLGLTIAMTLFGLLMVYDASSFISFRDFGTKYHYIKDQSVWMIFGLAGLTFFSFFDYKKLYNLALPSLIFAICLLVGVFLPGIGLSIKGAHRWINLHFGVLQPAEFVKLSLALYLSAWFSAKEKGRFTAFLLLTGLVLFLVMAEPDMGTTIIIFCEAFVIYFLSGGSMLYLAALGPIIAVLGFILIKIAPYRMDRLTTFLHVSDSIGGASYQVKQILLALGSGGLLGVGLGNSLQKYAYLPENTTDSIFAIIGEEIGFIGSFIFLIVCFLFIWRGLFIALRAKDTFGKLLAGGIIGFLGFQMVINLGAQTTLFPLTGVPLPFISYGGSSLVVDLCSVGILVNIARQSVS